MKLKDRIKTYNFWVSLSSAIFLLLKVLGSQFGFRVNENLFSDIVTSLCGILVILGIIVPPANKITINSENTIKQEKTLLADENLESRIVDIAKAEPTNLQIEGHEVSENIENTCENEFNDQQQNENPEDVFANVENCNHFETSSLINDIVELNENQIQEENHSEILTNDDDIVFKVAKTLTAQEKLFVGNSAAYIELLQKEIDLLKSK